MVVEKYYFIYNMTVFMLLDKIIIFLLLCIISLIFVNVIVLAPDNLIYSVQITLLYLAIIYF